MPASHGEASMASDSFQYASPLSELSEHILCPICLLPLFQPVITVPCAHAFCRSCITQAFRDGSTHEHMCPYCRTALSSSPYREAPPMIRAMVDALRVVCGYDGCTYECERHNLSQHQRLHMADVEEQACMYCAQLVLDMPSHLDVCSLHPMDCAMRHYGCTWHGVREDAANHAAQCAYHALEPILSEQQARITALEQYNRQLQEKMEHLEQEQTSCRQQADDCAYSLGKWLCSWPSPAELHEYTPALEVALDEQRRTLRSLNEAVRMAQQASENARAMAMRSTLDLSGLADEMASLWHAMTAWRAGTDHEEEIPVAVRPWPTTPRPPYPRGMPFAPRHGRVRALDTKL